jgi:hypothetical protein
LRVMIVDHDCQFPIVGLRQGGERLDHIAQITACCSCQLTGMGD